MDSDFSTMGRLARETIPVPALPMDSILSRSHAARARGRLGTFAACAAVTLAAVGFGTGVGAKIYDGVHVWLAGGRARVIVHSGTIMRHPMASELRTAIAGATFPVVFPVGIRADSRIDMVTLAPADHPSVITLSYDNGTGFRAAFALIDPAVVDPNVRGIPTGAARPPSVRTPYRWRVGGEIVIVADKQHITLADVSRIKAAMAASSPQASLALTETMLPEITVLGGTVRLKVAERYRPSTGRSVLLDQAYLRSIPGLVAHGKSMLDTRISTIDNIAYANGDIHTGNARKSNAVAISAGGVRAIDAVMRSAGVARGRTDCNCEILFNQPDASAYSVWIIPLSGPETAKKYSVDAKTFEVTPSS